MSDLAINLPGVHAEVSAIFARYEHALVNNHIDVLDALGQSWAALQFAFPEDR